MFDFFKEKTDTFNVYIIAEAANNDTTSTIFTNAVAVYESYADALNNLEKPNQCIMGPLPYYSQVNLRYYKMQDNNCNMPVSDNIDSPRQSPKTRRKD